MLLSPQQFQQVSGALSGQGANAVLVNLKDYRPQHTLCSTNQRGTAAHWKTVRGCCWKSPMQ